jgi:Ca2+-binding EF-hand superfamily protein
MGQMNAQSMQQRLDGLFSKIDSNSDGGIDKTEFAAFAKKMNADTGSSINTNDVFSTYDTNNDGKLSKNEVAKFMKDNAPAPPPQLSSAASTSGTDATSDLSSSLSDLLQSPEFSNTLSKLLSILKQYAGRENTASTVNITA